MSHWTYLIIAVLVGFGGFALMGLPGGLLMGTVHLLTRWLSIPMPDLGQKMLPLGLVLSLNWGLLLYPCYWAARLLGWPEWTTWPLWVATGLVMTTWMWRKTPTQPPA